MHRLRRIRTHLTAYRTRRCFTRWSARVAASAGPNNNGYIYMAYLSEAWLTAAWERLCYLLRNICLCSPVSIYASVFHPYYISNTCYIVPANSSTRCSVNGRQSTYRPHHTGNGTSAWGERRGDARRHRRRRQSAKERDHSETVRLRHDVGSGRGNKLKHDTPPPFPPPVRLPHDHGSYRPCIYVPRSDYG